MAAMLNRRRTAIGCCMLIAPGSSWVVRQSRAPRQQISRLHIYAPPGSGYFQPEDEEPFLSVDYDPIMEYPGTMRPARTRENIPFEDLPLADGEKCPVPWPHFQDMPYHYKVHPPHDHPKPINEFIEDLGLWATLEEEAETIRQARRAIKEQKALEASNAVGGEGAGVVMDDDDDIEEDAEAEYNLDSFSSFTVKSVDKVKSTVEEDGDFLLQELGLNTDGTKNINPMAASSSSNFDFDIDSDLGLSDDSAFAADEDDDDDENDTGDQTIDSLGEDIELDEDGVVAGSDKGKLQPNVPDDYETDFFDEMEEMPAVDEVLDYDDDDEEDDEVEYMEDDD